MVDFVRVRKGREDLKSESVTRGSIVEHKGRSDERDEAVCCWVKIVEMPVNPLFSRAVWGPQIAVRGPIVGVTESVGHQRLKSGGAICSRSVFGHALEHPRVHAK